MDRISNEIGFAKCGYETLDLEHEVFVGILKRIYQAYEDNREFKIKDGLLSELHKFIDFHFTSENNMMLLSNDPNYKEHRKDHQLLKEKLGSIISVFTAEHLDLDDLIDFFSFSMRNHANYFDYNLGQHLLKQENLFDALD